MLGFIRRSVILKIGLVVYGTLFAIMGPLSCYVAVVALLEARASRNWPSAPGTITESGVTEGGSTDAPAFQVNVRYRFRVGTRWYVGERVRAKVWAHNEWEAAEQIALSLPVGKRVRVFYDPADASRCVLQPGPTRQDYLQVLPGIPMFLTGAGAWVVFFLALRRPRAGPPPLVVLPPAQPPPTPQPPGSDPAAQG